MRKIQIAPQQFTVEKTISTVACLARLHNFLIDARDANCPTQHSDENEWSMAVDGAVPFAVRNGVRVPTQLMDAGHHHDDDPTRQRRDRARSNIILPREAMFADITRRNLRRATKN